MTNWVLKTAVEQIAALKSGAISATDLLSQTINRARSVAATVNPLASELYERAEIAAKKADVLLKKRKGGALCGLPITVKDSQWLAGERCANGSIALADFVPTETCGAIQRLESAGAVIFGKTTCPEFCLSGTNNSPLYGATLNPWNLALTPGGSSGGAAAAIAAGVGSLSLGSDGGGSVRIPAAFCGVVGFKPSHGVVPRSPGFTTWESLVAYGPMSRSVEDASLMFSVLANLKSSDEANVGDIRIIASEDLGFAPVDPDVRQTFRATIEQARQSGIIVREGNPGLKSSVITWATIATSDMWQAKGELHSEGFVPLAKMGFYAREFIKFGSRFSADEISDAQSHRIAIHDAYVAFFKSRQANILVTPTLGGDAFHHVQSFPRIIGNTPTAYPWLDWAGFLYDANLVGMPACSIPMGLSVNGLPIALHITGLPGRDLLVLKAAKQFEQLIGWEHQIAPAFVADPIIPGIELPAVAAVHPEVGISYADVPVQL